MPQAYISCLPEDRGHADKILDWWRAGLLGSGWTIAASQGEAPRRGVINVLLQNAAALILIVGAGTAQKDGITDEVNHVLVGGKRLVLLRPPGGSGAPPKLCADRPFCDFHPAKIRAALER